MELARVETLERVDIRAHQQAARLLTAGGLNLFAIAESNTRAGSNDSNQILPTDDARAAEYFRRLDGGAP